MASGVSVACRAILRRNIARVSVHPVSSSTKCLTSRFSPQASLATHHLRRYSANPAPSPSAKATSSGPHAEITRESALDQALSTLAARDFAAFTRTIDPIWLRDVCACSRCVSPSSGQKSFATTDIPGAIAIAPSSPGYDATSDTWRFAWHHEVPSIDADGPHLTEITSSALLRALQHRQPGASPRPKRTVARQPWDASTITSRLQRIPYSAWMGSSSTDSSSQDPRHKGLLDLKATGLLFITDVPQSQDSVRLIAERIANLQETFYGRTWDVINKPQAENVAYTNAYLGLHQDILYLTQPPRIQLLHCLENDASGGESLFSDGLRAAYETLLRLPDPILAEVLRRRVGYHYDKNGYTYHQSRPLIELAGPETTVDVRDARIENLWWSPPFQDTFAYADGGRSLAAWRAGAALFQEVLEHPSSVLELRLRPGECVVFDNVRVLHGRRAFARAGARHLKGAYIAHDDYQSALANVPSHVMAGYPVVGAEDGQGGTEERDEVVRLMALRDWEPEAVDG